MKVKKLLTKVLSDKTAVNLSITKKHLVKLEVTLNYLYVVLFQIREKKIFTNTCKTNVISLKSYTT